MQNPKNLLDISLKIHAWVRSHHTCSDPANRSICSDNNVVYCDTLYTLDINKNITSWNFTDVQQPSDSDLSSTTDLQIQHEYNQTMKNWILNNHDVNSDWNLIAYLLANTPISDLISSINNYYNNLT